MPDQAGSTDPSSVAVKFREAIEFLRRQLAISSDEWLRILNEEGATSTAIADDTVRSVTQNLAQAVLAQIEAGGTLADFRKDYDAIVQAQGWAYHDNAGWHSTLVFRLNTGNAYSAGRWEQAQRLEAAKPGTYFGRLITAGDNRVRDSHAEMQGIVRPIDDAYWSTHWPPNGFNCRCHVQILTARDLARYGYVVTPDGDPRLKVPPDKGWGYNPGVIGARLAQLAASALS